MGRVSALCDGVDARCWLVLGRTAIFAWAVEASIAVYKVWFGFRTSPIERDRLSPQLPRIAILVVLTKLSELSIFSDATATMRCYAGVAGYPIYHLQMDFGTVKEVVSGWNATRAANYCRGKWAQRVDFAALMYFRHCLVAEFLFEHEGTYDWVLEVDADIGVVNPQHRIEEWIDNDADVIFYTRCTAHELMAGSYLVRNTPGARRFLADWAAEGVDVWLSTGRALVNHDQSAIHEAFMRFFATTEERKRCRDYYLDPTPFPDNPFQIYIACTLHFLEQHVTRRTGNGVLYFGGGSLPRVKVFPRFAPGWVRDDTGLVTTKWAPSDFMMHNWKDALRLPAAEPNSNFTPSTTANWDTPFNESFADNIDLNQCVPEKREAIVERHWRRRWVPALRLENSSQLKPYFDAAIVKTDKFYIDLLASLPNKGNFSASANISL